MRISYKIISIYLHLIFIIIIAKGQSIEGYTFGGAQSDIGYSLCKSFDSNYVIAGTTRSIGAGSEDIFIIKTNSKGVSLWANTFGNEHYDFAKSITTTSSNEFLVTGYTWVSMEKRTQAFLMKLDTNGNLLWSHTFGGQQTEQAFYVKELQNKDILFLGYTRTFSNSGDFYFVKTSPNGDKIFEKYYSSANVDYGFNLAETADLGYLLVGSKGGFYNAVEPDYQNSNSDIMLIKTDVSGNELWRKTYGGNKHDFGNTILIDSENDVYVLGSTQSYGNGSFDMYLLKTDYLGNEILSATYGGSDFEYGTSMAFSEDNNLFLFGTTNSFSNNYKPDMYLIKTDLSGNKLWEIIIGGDNSEYGYSIVSDPDSGCTVLGATKSFGVGKFDVYLIKIDKDGNIEFINNPNIPKYSNAIIYPNPFINTATIKLETPNNFTNDFTMLIYDINGNLVKTSKIILTDKTQINRDNLSSGTYLFNIESNNNKLKFRGKFIVY